jgi:hypothetical protein
VTWRVKPKPQKKTGMAALRALRRDKEKAAKNLEERLKEMKLSLPPPPTVLNPQLPKDITAVSDRDLGRLYGEFASMAMYVGPRVALQAMQAAVDKRSDKVCRSLSHLKQIGTVADKSAMVECDATVVRTSQALLVSESTHGVTEALYNGILVGRDALSREITRRQGERERHVR